MKDAFDRLKQLTDTEDRLAMAITYATTQRIAEVTTRIEQKVDIATRAIDEIRVTQQGRSC